MIVIGASAGGIDALDELLANLPARIPATLVAVVHMHPLHDSRLASLLSKRAAINVVPAEHGQPVEPGTAYIARPDLHVLLNGHTIRLDRGPKQHRTRPAVDPLFVSAANGHRSAVVGVLLSGRGEDGVAGLIEIKAKGGLSLVQDPNEAAYPSMPMAAIQRDEVDAALPVARLARALARLAAGGELNGDAGSSP